jgi:hypothetical protein
MKNLLLTLIVVVALSMNVSAQETKESGVYFGAIVGTKINSFNKQFITNVDPEFYSFSIGAGSAWTKNNYVVGVQFLYSSGSNSNNSGEIQYTGFENALTFGYNISRSRTWRIEPNIGIMLSNNQLIVQDKESGSFQNLANNQVTANAGIDLKLINQNGLFTGIKIGYQLPLSGDTEWINKVSDRSSGLKDNIGAFYVQLNIGGLLSLVSAR